MKVYSATKTGADALFNENPQLAEAARTIVMWCLKTNFGKNEERSKIALREAGMWMGMDNRSYRRMFINFKDELRTIEFDENDEHGLADETVKVANLMLKYKELREKESKSIW